MPLARNKIILNGIACTANQAVIDGNTEGIQQVYNGAQFLSDEFEELNLLKEPEALKFKERMENLCTPFHAAQKRYQSAQLAHKDGVEQLVDDMRNYIDGQILKP